MGPLRTARGRSRPARPAGPQSQRATGEAWRNVPTTESGELRASSVTQSDAQPSAASGTSFRTHTLRRGGAHGGFGPGGRIARRYLWSYGPCSVARRTWTNKARVNRCLPRPLHRRVALKNTLRCRPYPCADHLPPRRACRGALSRPHKSLAPNALLVRLRRSDNCTPTAQNLLHLGATGGVAGGLKPWQFDSTTAWKSTAPHPMYGSFAGSFHARETIPRAF